ncbi:MAG: DUF4105 domain-containing protein [Prevotellaceae bacterium]|jgi:hypothetical protein|nr:DUF4105 domain-containing protein [Prevotellaceae bacterium]
MKKILFILFLCLVKANLAAFTLSPEARISLLTCAPGEEVYAKFGHTAIRVNDAANGIDEVFNYGIFDFSSDSFLYRFIKGETDYMLGTTSFDYLVWEYENRHSAVVEQVLNLTEEEKQNLFDALIVNSLPENRVYRYNYFFDNCSTRPRLMVEQAVGNIFYQELNNNTKNSFRNEIYRLVGKNTWLGFGIDLLIGSEADLPFESKESLFLPDNLMLAFENAQINRWGEVQPLVAEERFIVEGMAGQASNDNGFSPVVAFWLLCFAVLVLSFLFYRKNKRGVWLDMLLFGAVGLAGCLIAFLVFFSVHPAVNPNYNLLWAQPLHLLFALILPFKALKKWQQYYAAANAFVLLGTLIFYAFIPQQFNPAFFPLILCLLVRSLFLAPRL